MKNKNQKLNIQKKNPIDLAIPQVFTFIIDSNTKKVVKGGQNTK